MNIKNEKKQTAMMWLLTILIVILAVIISGLIGTAMRIRREANTDTKQQLAQMQQELETIKEH